MFPQRPRRLSLVVGQTNMETATPPRLNCDRIRDGFRHSVKGESVPVWAQFLTLRGGARFGGDGLGSAAKVGCPVRWLGPWLAAPRERVER
jgi:hypothetical protein